MLKGGLGRPDAARVKGREGKNGRSTAACCCTLSRFANLAAVRLSLSWSGLARVKRGILRLRVTEEARTRQEC